MNTDNRESVVLARAPSSFTSDIPGCKESAKRGKDSAERALGICRNSHTDTAVDEIESDNPTCVQVTNAGREKTPQGQEQASWRVYLGSVVTVGKQGEGVRGRNWKGQWICGVEVEQVELIEIL
jgi:hypothetical protein